MTNPHFFKCIHDVIQVEQKCYACQKKLHKYTTVCYFIAMGQIIVLKVQNVYRTFYKFLHFDTYSENNRASLFSKLFWLVRNLFTNVLYYPYLGLSWKADLYIDRVRLNHQTLKTL